MFLPKLVELGKKEEGFTLVELLIVVAIIAILAAIAIPQFSAYRKRGYAATLNSDGKNAFTAAQALIVDTPTATIDPTSDCSGLTLGGYKRSDTGISCSGTMTAGTGTISLAAPATWYVTTVTYVYDGSRSAVSIPK